MKLEAVLAVIQTPVVAKIVAGEGHRFQTPEFRVLQASAAHCAFNFNAVFTNPVARKREKPRGEHRQVGRANPLTAGAGGPLREGGSIGFEMSSGGLCHSGNLWRRSTSGRRNVTGAWGSTSGPLTWT